MVRAQVEQPNTSTHLIFDTASDWSLSFALHHDVPGTLHTLLHYRKISLDHTTTRMTINPNGSLNGSIEGQFGAPLHVLAE